jgi:hypothetical protein
MEIDKRQSRMDNSKMQAILGTRHNTKTKKKKQKKTKNKKQKTNQQTNKQTNKKHKTKMSITDPTKNGGEPRRPGSVKHCCFF